MPTLLLHPTSQQALTITVHEIQINMDQLSKKRAQSLPTSRRALPHGSFTRCICLVIDNTYVRTAKQQSNRLQSKINQLIESEGIQLQPNDAEDISQIVEDVTPTVVENFPESSPQRVFWDQQRIYNRLGNKRQMRWHPLVLRFALNLKYMSTSAYRAVRQSGIINLPSERTLSDYTHWISPHSGLQVEYVDKLHTMLAEALPSQQHQCTLSMDEMKIKSGLVFNKHTGSLVGFGDVNRDIQKIISGEHGESTSGNLASHVFVLMARAVFKPSLCVPVAHYFSSNLKGKISMNVTVCV